MSSRVTSRLIHRSMAITLPSGGQSLRSARRKLPSRLLALAPTSLPATANAPQQPSKGLSMDLVSGDDLSPRRG
jgi:hypothetical protein